MYFGMKRIVTPFESREKWLDLRQHNINSTESPCLFGASPYGTKYELYFQKKDQIRIDIEETERMRIGSKLEAAIAELAAEEHGFKIRPKKEYISIPELKMGSSFDYEAIAEDGTPLALAECKNVDSL